MKLEGAVSPVVTIVVVPREKFGAAEQSLDAIIANTSCSYRLIYIDGRSPGVIAQRLRDKANRHGFEYVRVDRYLSPNEARNMGWRLADTPYVVFVDNDVVPAPGWLDALVGCAEETDADLVTPLICHGLPLHSTVHQAGGLFTKDLDRFYAAEPGTRLIEERLHFAGKPVGRVLAGRQETQLCEFHAILVRRNLIERIGLLDENMLATREHLDFCMSVLGAGGKAIFEPLSVVTYLLPKSAPLRFQDWPYYLVRWSESWQRRSIAHFQQKWGFALDQQCFRNADHRYRFGYDSGLVGPFVRRLPFTRKSSMIRRAAMRFVRPIFHLAGARLSAAADRERQSSLRQP